MWSTVSKAIERVEYWKVSLRYDNSEAYGYLYKNTFNDVVETETI